MERYCKQRKWGSQRGRKLNTSCWVVASFFQSFHSVYNRERGKGGNREGRLPTLNRVVEKKKRKRKERGGGFIQIFTFAISFCFPCSNRGGKKKI